MIGKDVTLIEYSEKVDFGNCITHIIGAVMGAFGLAAMVIKAQDARHTAAAVIYGLSMVAVYTVSAVYHGLKQGEAKRLMRIADHSTVPLLIAGTATPCALISLYNVSAAHGLFVLITAWFCTLFGLFSKLFFFEKLKTVTMTMYILLGAAMLLSVVPLLDRLNTGAFGQIVFGAVLYLLGAVFCGLGVKKPALHIVFHIFVVLGSGVHLFAIYTYII